MGKESAEFVSAKPPAAEEPKKSGFSGFMIVGAVAALGMSVLVYAQLEFGVLDHVLAKNQPEAAAPSSPAEEEEEKPVVRKKSRSVPVRPQKERAVADRMSASDTASPASRPVRRFPAAGDIEKGMPALSIRKEFGAPVMKTTDSESGRLVERWTYMSRELGSTTVVVLVDGKAALAETSDSR